MFLQANRTWLLGVLTRTAAGGTDAAAGAVPAPQDQLLPSLLASLLRCIAPEVRPHCASGLFLSLFHPFFKPPMVRLTRSKPERFVLCKL